MRWLLLKDLQILRRSPLLVALLVLYPLLVALLVGVALSSGPSKPKVAFANLVPPGQAQISLGGQKLDATTYAAELFETIDPIRVDSREAAIAKVRSGEAVGALVVPRGHDPAAAGRARARGRRPADGRGLLQRRERAQAPLRRSRRSTRRWRTRTRRSPTRWSRRRRATSDLIVTGGKITLPIVGDVDVLGLRNAQAIVDGAIARAAAGTPATARRSSRSRASPASPPTTSTSPSRSWPRSRVRCGSRRRRSAARAHVARRVRDRGRGRALADVRRAPARGRHARAGARGARLRAARARAGLPHRRCSRRRSGWRRCALGARRW